ncbi:MAG: type II secretion system protein [Terrimicrobiaceae bacterium]
MRRGFTLIELGVVLVVIGVLTALVIPGYRYAIARADSAKCLGNLRVLGVALNGWLSDNNMMMPPLEAARANRADEVRVIDNTLNTFTDDQRVFACPADRSVAKLSGTSYYWNSALSGQSAVNLNLFTFITDLSRIPILVDKEGWHRATENKVNHLFADGHVANQIRIFADQ